VLSDEALLTLFPVDWVGMSNLISDFFPLANNELEKAVEKEKITNNISVLCIITPLIFQRRSMQNKYQKN
tara:strand:- start:422 stop:631 length:210 start_codon:yes stop_codon:yes gene_type:complete